MNGGRLRSCAKLHLLEWSFALTCPPLVQVELCTHACPWLTWPKVGHGLGLPALDTNQHLKSNACLVRGGDVQVCLIKMLMVLHPILPNDLTQNFQVDVKEE